MNREINTIGSKADGAARVRADHHGEGRAREDAGAGAECRVSRRRRARRGLLFIVSAPSGTGKTTLVERLVQVVPICRCRAPTRRGRPGPASTTASTIISSAGTASRRWSTRASSSSGPTSSAISTAPRRRTPRHRSPRGEDVVLVIDVQGARQVRSRGIETVGDLRAAAVGRGARAAAARPQQGQRGADPAPARGGAARGRRVRAVRLRRRERRGRGGGRAAAGDRAGGTGARQVDAARAETIKDTFRKPS